MVLHRLSRLWSRLLGFVIIPAQFPGDLMALSEDLMTSPWETIRTWSPSLIWQLLMQILKLEKLTVADDPMPVRMTRARNQYLSRGWEHCPMCTRDGVTIDACIKPPANDGISPRYVIYIGGNMQIYEFWLAFFHIYAQSSELGFLCFNFRGVGHSEGAITSCDDMLIDIDTMVRYLLEKGVLPEHIVLHGFSIGGALAAQYLVLPETPDGICLVTDRSFRSFCHAAYAICRGFDAAVGRAEEAGETDELLSRRAQQHERGGLPSPLRRVLARLLSWLRAVVAYLATNCLRSGGWELSTEAVWDRIRGPKAVIYNRADNIVSYEASSLHYHLERVPHSLAGAHVVEVTFRDPDVAMHDFPLTLDVDAWYALMDAERAMLGMTHPTMGVYSKTMNL
jgi:pimeloyl-ACP methyl ester carboxylesterase